MILYELQWVLLTGFVIERKAIPAEKALTIVAPALTSTATTLESINTFAI